MTTLDDTNHGLATNRGCPLRGLTAPSKSIACPFTRSLVFAYGMTAYLLFFAAITYAIGFVGNWFVPKSIDSGVTGSLPIALCINLGLLTLFAVQHSVMARPGFKRWWTRFIPECMERSTYVLFASVILLATYALWRPLPTIVWDIQWMPARIGLSVLALVGWMCLFASSAMVSHGDLFGVRQVWHVLRRRTYKPVEFREVGFYKHVRHPLMTSFFIAFWSTPTMTLGHLLFAGMCSAYILVGTTLEERDLIAEFGDRYERYRRVVPAFIPRLRGN
ncbi:MAG: methanethiol S-methyltransferase [Planctomycetota bacterium]